MTASVIDFERPFGELGGIYRTLEEKRALNPTMELWAFARKEVVYKIESLKQKIRNMNSDHPIRKLLIAFGDSLVAAAKAETRDEVELNMEHASKLHVDAAKEFRKWRDEEFQREMKRKSRTTTSLESRGDQGVRDDRHD